MKKLPVFVFILYCFFLPASAQLPDLQSKATIVKRLTQLKHYSPRAVNDSFSASMFDIILNTADEHRILFTDAEYKQLAVFRNQLDNELNGEGWQFADLFAGLYKKALLRADTIIHKVCQKPFDYNLSETLGLSKKKQEFVFAADIAGLSNRWSRYLKFLVLNEIFESLQADSTRKKTLVTAIATLEPAVKEKIKKTELRNISKILDNPAGYNSLISELYLNALAGSFDPHTNYFSPLRNEEFQSALSTESWFFGINFKENDKGAVIIDKLTPGGAAWNSGEIHSGDELVALQWEGKEMQDMTGVSMEEVFKVLDLSNHDKMLFRLRKSDGTISNVTLRKEKQENEENIVKSFVLKGEKNIGYILLPGFYTEWGMGSGSSCANDVAKEIVKLKKENIEGMILDVRFNGGGSVGEALEMTGIFIDEGPVCAIKTADGKYQTLKDPNRGTIFDGPMVLLVNGQSASASELLAATLQDYHRAVIAGSNTYGKATMQEMFALDTISGKPASGDLRGDMTKITTGKLYRVTGQTAQLSGVKPDVELPDAFGGLEIGEKFEENALPADSAKRNNYYKPLPYLPVQELASRSAARLSNSPDFSLIRSIVSEQQKFMQAATQTIPLKADLFEAWMKKKDQNLLSVKGQGKASPDLTAENHAADKISLQNNPYARELNDLYLQNLTKDIYIQEAFHIITDLINIQKSTH